MPGNASNKPLTIEFLSPFLDNDCQGLYFNHFYLPEELVMLILSYVPPQDILSISLTCKTWHNIIKSEVFWYMLYKRQYRRKPKKLPWYVYYCLFTSGAFNTNLIKNPNGQEQFKHWQIVRNFGDEFRVEPTPQGSDLLPRDVPEFLGAESCFASSYYECVKLQAFAFERNYLLRFVMSKYKPHIYLSEWVAGRFDCGCVYALWGLLCGADGGVDDERGASNVLHKKVCLYSVKQWEGKAWTQIEMVLKNYPADVVKIVFRHEGKDTQFWKGHYGSKMAGGVLTILFDTIEPIEE